LALRRTPDWRIHITTDWRHGLDLIMQLHRELNVVLLNIYLLGLDGRLVCERIHAIDPPLPIIMTLADEAALLKVAGAVHYAPKADAAWPGYTGAPCRSRSPARVATRRTNRTACYDRYYVY
jgi:CheY-like chemotaxis protein